VISSAPHFPPAFKAEVEIGIAHQANFDSASAYADIKAYIGDKERD
jgi:hypothetical protein